MTNLTSFSFMSERVRVASNELQDIAISLESSLHSIEENFKNNSTVFGFHCSECFNAVTCIISNDGIDLVAENGSLELMGKLIERIERRFFKAAKLETREASKHFLNLTYVWEGEMLELDTEKPTSI